jgi:hypothetical protein
MKPHSFRRDQDRDADSHRNRGLGQPPSLRCTKEASTASIGGGATRLWPALAGKKRSSKASRTGPGGGLRHRALDQWPDADAGWFWSLEIGDLKVFAGENVRWICHRCSRQGPPDRVGAGCPMRDSDGRVVHGASSRRSCTGRDLRAKEWPDFSRPSRIGDEQGAALCAVRRDAGLDAEQPLPCSIVVVKQQGSRAAEQMEQSRAHRAEQSGLC